MSKVQEPKVANNSAKELACLQKVREKLAVPQYQIHTPTNNEVAEENVIYVAQLQELARVFSSSGDRHIRQYIINLARGVLERAGDYKRVEAYIAEMLS